MTTVNVNQKWFASQYLIVSLFLLFAFSAAHADVNGSVTGVVRDRAQAVVTGAKVQITNVQTNVTQAATTGADGTYHFLALPPGQYKISATASGFRTYNATDITLQVNDELRIDITLQVGAINETIDVSASAEHVETESTQLGDVVTSKQMLALPLNGRSYLDLLSLQAGVAPDNSLTIGGNTGTDARPVSGYLQNVGNVSVNGQRETANAFLVNGGDVSEGRNLGAGLVPNLDSVEEFRLITNSFDAEYGKFSGAVMNAITKSGTNGFHGDVFEFVRNDKLDAANFFTPQKSELRRNQFGFAIGGPFWKDKVFWFSDYQGTRQVQGAETGGLFLPTNDQRQGTFDPALFSTTQTINNVSTQVPNTVVGTATGAGNCPVCGWATELSTRLGYQVVPGEKYSFPGCASTDTTTGCVFPGGVIPKAAWSPAAIGTLSSIPAPNVTNQAFNFEDNSGRNRIRDDKIGERVDFHSQRTGDWSWYYHFDDSSVLNALGVSSAPGFPTTTPTRAQEFVMSNTKALGPTAVNEARATFFRTSTHANTVNGPFASLASLGFDNSRGQGIITDGLPSTKQFMPRLFFNGYSVGPSDLITFQPNNTYMVSDTFSKVIRNHTLKFGGEFRYLQVNERNLADVNGAFTFDGTVIGDGSIPAQAFADYLLGAPSANSGYVQAALQLLDSRTRYGGAFVQDTWKAKPNLTLNLGLRWEVSMPWYDTQGKIQTWVKGEQSTVFPKSPAGLVYPGDPGIPKTLAPTRYNNFGPRIGLAYSPDFNDGVLHKIFGGAGKTSIRAAFGLYYTSVEDLNLFFEVADAPFGLFWTSPGAVDFSEPFRNRLDGGTDGEGQRFPFIPPTPGNPANATRSFAIYEPMSFFPGYDIHNRLPYAEHFNLSIQRELSKSTVLTLAYVGTEGHRLIEQEDVNPGNAALCMQLNSLGAFDQTSGNPGCGPHGEQDTYTLPLGAPVGVGCDGTFLPSPSPTQNCIYGTRNFILKNNFCPESQTLCFGNSNTLTHLASNSIYNSFQATIERKAGDLTLLASYTLAKAIDNSSGFNDNVNFQNPRLSRGLSDTDVHHNFVASYIWAIPFQRAFVRLPKRLTQGWQLQGIVHLATGFPISLQQSGEDISLAGSSSTDMPDLVGKVKIVNPRNFNPNCPNSDGTLGATGCYFLPQAFAPNTTLGTFGTANRRFFHGPGINSFDMGLTKGIRITEAKSIEIRGEFFNIFNHAQFLNPSGDIDGNFGVVTNARDPRIGQLSAKFIW
ncbi:MAG TPA: carboxypeptidase regulatory-like domain-containing protein [Candidatus Sulfotelmatobacter sp.]|nr:carboxypeptidase regulatory-like domain-containing protein [Candidatus Sulfotelmatobacter sp.]